MNAKLARQYDVLETYRRLRDDLTAALSDGDLALTPGGENPPLGVLCRELGEVQKGYVESFKTFTADFEEHVDDEDLERSIEAIRAWYQQLDDELEEVLESLTDHDVDTRTIVRTPDFELTPVIHLDVFREALLIFYAKVTTYLKAAGRPRPNRWDRWLG